MSTNTASTPIPFPGLTPAEVEQSRREHGANILTPPARDPWWKQWLSKFEDPVIRILIIAAVIQIGVGAYKGEFIEGLAIVVAILLATTLAFFNEFKANREFDILNQVNDDTPVKAIRGGEFATIPRKDVVVGDILLIEAGEEIPCDGTVIEAVALLVDESKLTGESVPASKSTAETTSDHHGHEAAYPPNRVTRGSLVVDGHGILRVSAVGDGTEIGKTAKAAAEQSEEKTPLSEQLERLSKIIGIVGLGMSGLTFTILVLRGAKSGQLDLEPGQWVFTGILFAAIVIGLSRVWLKIAWEGVLAFRRSHDLDPPHWLSEDSLGRWVVVLGLGLAVFAVGLGLGSASGMIPAEPNRWLPPDAGKVLLDYFMIAVVIIVVAVPEGLAMSVTLSLAYSMRKMTAQNTLVRKMHACETIGAATVICSDKTGTLTQNRMTVAELRIPILPEQLEAAGSPALPTLVIDAFAVNSTAQLAHEDGKTKVLGNPTEGALLLWLEGRGVGYLAARASFTTRSQLTFSTERKYMATVGTDAADTGILHVKGAPEIVLAQCDTMLTPTGPVPLTDAARAELQTGLGELQARAMRTIGFAYRPVEDVNAEIGSLVTGLTWIGYVGIMDPIRPEVPPAIAACRRAGIGVKIVTGDTPATAREIARQIGLVTDANEPGIEMTGPEFAALSEEQAAEAVKRLRLLARARPMDKMRLVRLLQDQREVVAVTGDGTNDAPALNHAKVGLAMGRTGTAVAKESADIVLLDDSFGSIVNGVRWGRGLYENIQRFIVFQLTINFVALGVALLGPFVGVSLPLTVMQMLWVNLIMDTFAALALATEPPHADVMDRKPRDPNSFIVTPVMARLVFGVGGIFLGILLMLLFMLPGMRDPGSPDYARSLTMFFTIFVLMQFWNLFNARCVGSNRSALEGLLQNKAFLLIAGLILTGQVVLVQFGGEVFRTIPLSIGDWGIILLSTSPVLIVGEVQRFLARRSAG